MDNENLLKMAQFIMELRKEKELTQRDLAEQLGVTDKAVSKWERGLSCPDISLLSKLSHVLGVTTSELLNGERTNPPNSGDEAKDGTMAQVNDASTSNVKSRNAVWKFIAKASITAFLAILILIGCNLAIESGLGWAILPLKITFFIWLAVILGAFIMGKNKISTVLLCSSLIYFSTFYYASLNETQAEVINTLSEFPKAYIPHYTIILVMLVVSIALVVTASLKKNRSGDTDFLLTAVSITIIILSLITVPSIMDYVDLNALGVDGTFTILLLLNVVTNSILLALLSRRYIRQMVKS